MRVVLIHLHTLPFLLGGRLRGPLLLCARLLLGLPLLTFAPQAFLNELHHEILRALLLVLWLLSGLSFGLLLTLPLPTPLLVVEIKLRLWVVG